MEPSVRRERSARVGCDRAASRWSGLGPPHGLVPIAHGGHISLVACEGGQIRSETARPRVGPLSYPGFGWHPEVDSRIVEGGLLAPDGTGPLAAIELPRVGRAGPSSPNARESSVVAPCVTPGQESASGPGNDGGSDL